MPAAVKTAFDIAFWFADTALNDNEYLQPQKMHRLMFLAQAYFAVAFEGRSLMPAHFVADEMGPMEPNVFAAFSRGRPDVDVELFLPNEVEEFLQNIWRRFGHYSTDKLTEMTKKTLAYEQAYKRGRRAEITLEAMRRSFTRAEQTPGVGQVIKPKVMRTQSGRPVTVKSWAPKTVDPKNVIRSLSAERDDAEKRRLRKAGGKRIQVKAWNPAAVAPSKPVRAEPPEERWPEETLPMSTPGPRPEPEDLDPSLSPKERIRAKQERRQKEPPDPGERPASDIMDWAPELLRQLQQGRKDR